MDRNKDGTFKKGHMGMGGDKNPMWKGGRNVDEKGYIRISIGKKRYRTEHRIVMEEYLGRQLDFDEVVHHINHDRSDNRIENLELISRKEHGRIHGLEAVKSPLHPNNK